MTIPLAVPPTLDDLRAAAVVLEACSRGNSTLAFNALDAIAEGEDATIPATSFTPFGVYQVSADLVVIAISGTASLLQWVLNVLGSPQMTVPPIPGQVASYWAAAALAIRQSIGPAIVPLLSTRRLVVLGHSLGGAIGQVLFSMWGDLALPGSQVITFGCPRVGNIAFADAVGNFVTRIEDTDDPIVTVPPVFWTGFGAPWQWPLGLKPALYAHAGHAITVDLEGNLRDGEEHITVYDAYAQLDAGSAPTHAMTEYLRRLDRAAAWARFGPAFDDPPALDQFDEFLNPRVDPLFGGDGHMATCQGTMFFRTSEEAQGWGESWYADTSVELMLEKILGLIPDRANFLAGTCEIHAYRAAIVAPPPAVRRSRAKRLTIPQHASVSIKDIDAAGRTNETMDAIDMQVNSENNASRKQCFFRGIPDPWVGGSALTPEGREGLKIIQGFLAKVKAAGLQLRVYDRANPVKNVESMTQDALTKLIKVTVTAHGFANGAAVTLRRTRANPMLAARWKIGVVDPNTFLLAGSSKFNVNSANDGTVQLYGTQVDPIQDFDFAGISTRKTGRPFGSRRGKKSAKLIRH